MNITETEGQGWVRAVISQQLQKECKWMCVVCKKGKDYFIWAKVNSIPAGPSCSHTDNICMKLWQLVFAEYYPISMIKDNRDSPSMFVSWLLTQLLQFKITEYQPTACLLAAPAAQASAWFWRRLWVEAVYGHSGASGCCPLRMTQFQLAAGMPNTGTSS